jgi:hypothetical protein
VRVCVRAPIAVVLVVASTALLSGVRSAHGVVVGGGGNARSDCLAVFDTPANTPARKPRHVRCTDGDSCDADGMVNGRCEIAVAVCVNSTALPACALAGVESITVAHAEDNGDPRFDPDMQALAARIQNDLELPASGSDLCATAARVHVPVRGPLANGGCKPSKKTVQMKTRSQLIGGRAYKDIDRIRLTCDPAPAGCDARARFAGTFDRIQRQIFDQSCALSGCHDSQSRAGNLLLETGAAHANLVGVPPSNAAALAAGWQRITVVAPALGDPATSFLFHKLVGPPPEFGARMPFGRPKLDQDLIDIVQLWIAAGAPATGWVSGTD